jgi:hypothetical protein
MPTFRQLKGYAFDPSFSSTIGKRQSNQVNYKVRWEEINAEKPFGEYIDIIDYDPSIEAFYDLVDLNSLEVLANHGLEPTEGNPKFHHQQVYAVVMSVISQFEKALGRKIIWSRRLVDEEGNTKSYEFVPKLRIYPHAIRQQNAFYSPEKVALLFGYFEASNNWSGNNVPGLAIFTCLSPDIVSHEATHAIIDSMHPYWRFPTNPDMLAFHEGFSDIIALLQRFTFTNVVEDQIRNSKGDLLSSQNLLGDLAIQFGQAISTNRRALRSFLVKTENGKTKPVDPDPSKYYTIDNPHERGAILVAAIFDAFARLYKYQVADLLRIASNGTGILAQGEISPDLVKRLSQEACEIAIKLLSVCIRAIDYCPPLDLTFGDYLRALITADMENNPDEEESLRFALLESFRSWGIVPKGINTFSVDSMVWKPLDNQLSENKIVDANSNKQKKLQSFKDAIKVIFDPDDSVQNYDQTATKSIEKILRQNDREKIYENYKLLGAEVHKIFDKKFDFFKNNEQKDIEKLIGMSFSDIFYRFTNVSKKGPIKAEKRNSTVGTGENMFSVYKCIPVIRHNQKDGAPSKLMIITLLQKVFVDLKESDYKGYFKDDKFTYRGGATLIIDLSNFEIKYAIIKDINDSERLQRQIDFTIANLQQEENAALMMKGNEPFAALHIH